MSMASHQLDTKKRVQLHRLCKGEHMYKRWPGLTLDNAVAVTSDRRTRLRWGVKLTHGPARQARGATNSPTRDARPPLRARMRSPRVMIAAWFVVVVLLFTGAPFWVCAIASVPFVVVVLFGVLTETKARRRSHRRPIGADPGPDEENDDNRSGQRAADDGARPSASPARPEDGVPAMPPRLQPPDDEGHGRAGIPVIAWWKPNLAHAIGSPSGQEEALAGVVESRRLYAASGLAASGLRYSSRHIDEPRDTV
jgi:hypothetical protein